MRFAAAAIAESTSKVTVHDPSSFDLLSRQHAAHVSECWTPNARFSVCVAAGQPRTSADCGRVAQARATGLFGIAFKSAKPLF